MRNFSKSANFDTSAWPILKFVSYLCMQQINSLVLKFLLKLRDIRHDNLNAFIGACTEPPNICIITEYCSRGSLKDVLENEAIKLDQMFIASLVFDLIRVSPILTSFSTFFTFTLLFLMDDLHRA